MKRARVLFVALLAFALAAICGCTKVYTNDDGGGPTAPSGRAYDVEYRVSGSATSVRITYNNSQDGSAQVVSALPWAVKVRANESTLFVSLEATPIAFSSTRPPFLVAQIFINGALFREASATDFFTPLVVSATYRR